MSRYFLILVLLLSVGYTAIAIAGQPYRSGYEGQEKRAIKSLSEDDIEQLREGKGWGLAKAAELNGLPGPSHLLQMKEKIALTKEQEVKIQALFENMRSEAIPLGNKLIALEQALDESFANKTITNELLADQLNSIYKVRKDLRYVHLAAHLMTPSILTPRQIDEYNRLRGYGSGDPCKNIPEGHDKEMWKKHNDCR